MTEKDVDKIRKIVEGHDSIVLIAPDPQACKSSQQATGFIKCSDTFKAAALIIHGMQSCEAFRSAVMMAAKMINHFDEKEK